jgi:PAS domain S-box-containing protein
VTVSAIVPMTGSYDHTEVARSVLIAIAASYVALDLTGRVAAASGRVRLAWFSGGAIAMGIGIWAMHFKGMLAFHLPVSVDYHWPTILAALLVAIFASTVAMYVASRQKMGWREALNGSVIMGAGIAGLHYIAMAAMRLPAITRYSPLLVTASLLLAVLFSLIALLMAFDLREETRWTVPRRVGSAMVMGLAVSAMHYTGMAAASFIPAPPPDLSHAVSISAVGNNAIAIVTLIVLVAAMVTSSVDRRASVEFERLNQDLERRVAERTLQLQAVNQALRKEIAERERAEKSVRRSEDRLRLVIDTLPALVWSKSPDGSADFLNQRFREYTGLSVEEGLGWGWMVNAFHPEDRAEEEWRAAFAAGEPFEKEARLRRADGAYRWFLVRAVPLRDEQGHVVRWYGTTTDIEERKRAEAELRESEARFRLVADSAPVMIWMSGTDKLCTYFNKPWLGFTGRSIDHELGKGWTDGVHPDDLQRCLDTYIQAFDRREAFRMEYRLRRHDGEFRWILDMGVPRFNPDGSFAGYIGSCIDVTEQRRAEEQLRQAQGDLTRVARIATMGELTASIAHEINQPLAAVATNASASLHWLDVQPSNLAEARQAMTNAMNEADRASRVIERLRTLLKKVPPQLQPLNVNDVIRDVLVLAHRELITGGVAIRTELASDLPAVVGDRVQLQQVMLNLVMNAIDAMITIKDRPRLLVIKSSSDAEDVQIEVQDSGKGLDAQQASRIFDSFFTTKPDGIGMGLSISRSIVEAHGGRLQAIPGSSQGAVFQVILPKAA